MQRTAYLVTDEAGHVLAWRYDIHQALRAAERFRDQRGSHVLVTKSGGVLAVACSIGSTGGADKILQDIDAAFRPYERFSERKLAEEQKDHKPVQYNNCVCGVDDWDLLPNEGTAICNVCKAYALVRKDHYGCTRKIPKKCSGCKLPATERRRRFRCTSNQSYLYFCSGCVPPEEAPPKQKPETNHCVCGDSRWRIVEDSHGVRICATCGCYGRRYNWDGNAYCYPLTCNDCDKPATKRATRRVKNGNRLLFFCEGCVGNTETANAETQQCARCAQQLAWDQFYTTSTKPSGHDGTCKTCRLKLKKEARDKRKDRQHLVREVAA